MWKEYNPNPDNKRASDCVIRAITKVLETSWEEVYLELLIHGFKLKDMPSINHVWGSYLQSKGFTRQVIPNTCPDCYTIHKFANDHPEGAYILATGSHAVAVVNGNYYDTWDSGEEIPIYYFERGLDNGRL